MFEIPLNDSLFFRLTTEAFSITKPKVTLDAKHGATGMIHTHLCHYSSKRKSVACARVLQLTGYLGTGRLIYTAFLCSRMSSNDIDVDMEVDCKLALVGYIYDVGGMRCCDLLVDRGPDMKPVPLQALPYPFIQT